MRILQSLYDGGGGVAPQLAVTRRLVEHGHEVRVLAHVGLAASPDATPGELRAAIASALDSSELKSGAERMARILGRDDGVEGVVERIESLQGAPRHASFTPG